MADRRQGHNNPAGRPLSEEEFADYLATLRLKLLAWPIGTFFLGMGAFVLMATPLAHAIAGTNTNFTVSFSIAVDIAFGVTAAAGGVGCVALRRSRNYYKKRARRLEKELMEARAHTGNKEAATARSTK